jgi:riboflavin kinase
MAYDYLEMLMYISKKAGVFKALETSTIQVAKELKTSQQTVSRKLRDMEKLGLIKRTATQKGLLIQIDIKGREFLKRHYADLGNIFAEKEEITGIIAKGIGEGRYYVSLPGYQKQFEKKLGFKPYPGTLNIRVKRAESLEFISSLEPINIDGFETKDRTFGNLTAYKIKIKDTKGAIIIPERTRHEEDIIEVIAPINLKQKLKLKENSSLKIQK